MRLREDTVVSHLPDFEGEPTRAETSTNVRAGRAVASLDEPQLPGWGEAPQARRRPPTAPPPRHRPQTAPPPRHRPQTAPPRISSPAAAARPQPQPQPQPRMPAPAAARPQPRPAPAFSPLPAADFEPSVVEMIPQPPRAAPVAAQVAPETPADARGQVIVMFGCRGGAGATTLAVNTAAQLSRAGKRVCLLDLDLQLGDVFVALDLEQSTSIAALAREASTIDGAALKRRLARHDSGVYALSQVGQVDDLDDSMAERLPALVSALCDHFDYVVVDGVRDFSDCALSVLDMADTIAMVLTQDVAAVRRAARALGIFRQLGYSEGKLALVLNRAVRSAQVPDAEVTRALNLPIAARVRNDYKRMHAALNEGALLGDVAPGKGVTRDLARLAEVVGGADARIGALLAGNQRPGPLSRLFGRKGGK